MYYFAYGSNMSTPRLTQRIKATKVGIGKLTGYQLRFHKIGKNDGTGKCDSYFTDNSHDYVLGVVYEIAEQDKTELDRIEGLGHGYISKEITIALQNRTIQAMAYVATDIDTNLKPLDWYKIHVLYGAKENHLETAYIDMIDNVSAYRDTDTKRREKELRIYKES